LSHYLSLAPRLVSIIPAVILVLVILPLTAILLALVCAYMMALQMLQPPRMSEGKAFYVLKRLSPGDLGMGFEDVAFSVRDAAGEAIRLSGWWIPCPASAGRCAILLHGYADAKVGGIAWAPLFISLGYNVLAIDLRAHGDSGGRYSTGGYFERDDLKP